MQISKSKKLLSLLLSVVMLLGLVSTSVVTSSAESTKVGRVWEWNTGNYGVSVDSDTAVGTDPTQGLFLHYKGNRVATSKITLSSWNGGTFTANSLSEGSLGYINRATYLKFKISIEQMHDANGDTVDNMAVVLRMTVDGVVYTLKSNALDVPNEQHVEQFAIADFVKADDPSVAIDMNALRNGSEITDFQIDLVNNDGSQIKDVTGYLLGIDAYEANGNRIGTVWDWTMDSGNFTANGGSIDGFVPWSGEFGNGAPHYIGDSTLRDAITFTSWFGGCYTASGSTIGSLNHINNADYLQIDYNVTHAFREDGTTPENVAVTMNLVVGGVHYHNTQLAANSGTTTLVYEIEGFVKSDDTSVKLSKQALRNSVGKAIGDGYVSDMSMSVAFDDGSNIGNFQAYIIGVDAYDSGDGTQTATFDNGVAPIESDENGNVTLPSTTVSGKQFVGWLGNNKLYKAGETVKLVRNTAFTAVAVKLELQTGAGIRWAEREEERGIRFETFVSLDTLDTLGSSKINLGALILPYNKYSADITVDNASAYKALNVVSPNIYGTTTDGTMYRYYSGVVDFEKYFNVVNGTAVADLELTAISYITITYNDGTTKTFYCRPNAEDNVRSVSQVARAALADTDYGYSDQQIAILNLYNKYSAETDVPTYRKDAKDQVAKVGSETKICCIGDSLTEGITGNIVDGKEEVMAENYPYYLSQISGAEVLNYGRGGYKSTDSLNWYNQGGIDVTGADIIIIMLGTNGGMSGYENTQGNADYLSLIAKCRQDAPKAKIVLCTPPYVSNADVYGVAKNVTAAIPFIRNIAEKHNYTLVDVANCPDFNEANLSVMQPVDGVHFSAKGHETLAQYIYDGLVSNGLILENK